MIHILSPLCRVSRQSLVDGSTSKLRGLQLYFRSKRSNEDHRKIDWSSGKLGYSGVRCVTDKLASIDRVQHCLHIFIIQMKSTALETSRDTLVHKSVCPSRSDQCQIIVENTHTSRFSLAQCASPEHPARHFLRLQQKSETVHHRTQLRYTNKE